MTQAPPPAAATVHSLWPGRSTRGGPRRWWRGLPCAWIMCVCVPWTPPRTSRTPGRHAGLSFREVAWHAATNRGVVRQGTQGAGGGPMWEYTGERYNGFSEATMGRPRQRWSPRLRAAGIARDAPTGVHGGERHARCATEHVAGPSDCWMVRGPAVRRDLSRSGSPLTALSCPLGRRVEDCGAVNGAPSVTPAMPFVATRPWQRRRHH